MVLFMKRKSAALKQETQNHLFLLKAFLKEIHIFCVLLRPFFLKEENKRLRGARGNNLDKQLLGSCRNEGCQIQEALWGFRQELLDIVIVCLQAFIDPQQNRFCSLTSMQINDLREDDSQLQDVTRLVTQLSVCILYN